MSMRIEIHSAANFLVSLLKLQSTNSGYMVEPQLLELFGERLIEALGQHYRDHWFPEKPFKGSAYRCLRINGTLDPVISKVGESCGLEHSFLHSLFPSELTMWIDPNEVSYRFGENGSICVLFEDEENFSSSSDISPPSTPHSQRYGSGPAAGIKCKYSVSPAPHELYGPMSSFVSS